MLVSCDYNGLDIISFFHRITGCGFIVQVNLPCNQHYVVFHRKLNCAQFCSPILHLLRVNIKKLLFLSEVDIVMHVVYTTAYKRVK